MATEATFEPIATTSTSPDHELNITEPTSHDVASQQPVVNGTFENDESKPDTEHLDPNVISAEVSVSGGSDTEASKAETTKTQGSEKGHVRTTSTVKKLASFKPVSVNKTFLAAKGATTTAPSKLGDKGSAAPNTVQVGPTTSATARPRLVAKLGSGLRDSAPKNSATANGGKAGAPDANAVWNKNRPAPAPEPKRFTDEELKQRYGIHLATRLQSDEPGKQANWADIDDEDDDWAPEAIEWNDGTKITLPQADETPAPPPPEPVPAIIVKEKAPEIAKPKSPAPSQASASPTVRPSGFGGRAGLVLKGAAEKPTLVAKPPGPPTPVKSPWAPLPPVEKVAPVVIEVPQQQPPPNRFSQRDPHGFQNMPPPTKEIAADDFSRSSWREGSSTNKELYNSQSGRYEPVNDSRKGSLRNDARAHQPAVLQRPSNQDGPAEPSAAFQTRATGGHDGAYSRRRTSSNVSGGSGNFTRRMSRGDMPPPHEMLNTRRGSLAAVSDEPPSPRNFSPSGQYQSSRGYHQQWQSRASPVISHNSPQSAHGQTVQPASATSESQIPPSSAVFEDPLEVQKKVMQEKRALAIARRKEEEAREEAAKRERIALKLASMGPPPETKKKDATKEEKSAPTQIHTREAKDPEPARTPVSEVDIDSKVKPGEPINETVKQGSLDRAEGDSVSKNNRPNGIHHPQEHQPQENSQDRSAQWQNNSSSAQDRYKPWAAAPSPQSSSRNVWGPPTNDRTLGNGTFNPELSRLPEMHTPSHPGPIGPPNRGNNQNQQGHGRDQYNSRPAPIGPPTRRQAASQVDPTTRAAVATSSWGTLPSRIAQEDALLAQQQDLEKARMQDLRDKGAAPETSTTVLQDTWRQVKMQEDGTRSKVQANITTVHGDTSQSRGVFEEQDNAQRRPLDVTGNQTQFTDSWRASSNMNAAPPTRGSRFFPNNRDVRLEEQNMIPDRPGSPTPPPPTMAGHPAYDGDIEHPHVSLPRPPPIVKLPPPTVLPPIGPPKPASFAAAVSAPAVPAVSHNSFSASRATQYQDIRKQEPVAGGWQDKINSLIGRKNSPPKTHVLAVDSSSKNALELPHQQRSATVSLPSIGLGDLAIEAGSVESKPAAEECFEEQEMGSLPTIRLPRDFPGNFQLATQQPRTLPKKFLVSEVMSAETIPFPQQVSNNNLTITIKVPGQDESTNVSLAITPRQKSNPRRGSSRGGGNSRHSSSSHPRGGRGREASSGFSSPSLDNTPTASSSNTTTRGGRGRGAYGNSWTRHISTPVHT